MQIQINRFEDKSYLNLMQFKIKYLDGLFYNFVYYQYSEMTIKIHEIWQFNLEINDLSNHTFD